jgi:hypothetical protein
VLSRFRCRSFYLPVNNARFGVDTADINCKICSKNVVGDEYHYLLVCPFFEKERREFLNVDKKSINLFQMRSILNCDNHKNVKNLYKFQM